jgi:hypothetical protein
MTRLTRLQVQDRNRETVLRVAREAFLRDGYVATSLASVDYAIGVAIRQVVNREASPERFLRLVAPLVRLLQP